MAFDLKDLPRLNWMDLDETNRICTDILQKMSDRAVLRSLVERTENDPELFALCETHALDDKIVLHNDLPNGYRIRLRLANDEQYERAHNHRFSFTTLILHGTYYQRWYEVNGPVGDQTTLADVKPVCIREEPQGSIFTIDHDTIHSTLTSKDTISLVICGPAMKDKAFIIRMDSGEVWYKVGKSLETEERKKEVLMTRERFAFWKSKLEKYEVI